MRGSTDETKNIVESYCGTCIKQGWYVWKDILDMLHKGMDRFPPVRIKDMLQMKNKDQMMKAVYAHADFINWNNPQNNMYLNYLAMRTFSWINDDSRSILLNYIKTENKETEHYRFLRSRYDILRDTLWNRVKREDNKYWKIYDGYKDRFVSDDEVIRTISDYINMCRQLHVKINLKFTSAKKD